ncbi:hypothetical protein H2198_006213 [Neophaeococcomyces mojaviensis]|uniref:Uncharacterized protein n=1 Tax=Neophaeococcomyces mojaviensis TaxID=3383035 RepID=A0ACC3A3F4_9EURO|nr:hypothetical protein H2198_006213 [Knufia sp. JES_112]
MSSVDALALIVHNQASEDRLQDEITPATLTSVNASSSQGKLFTSRYSSEIIGNPFATPGLSTNSSSVNFAPSFCPPIYSQSRRIKKKDIEKPWLKEDKDRKQKWQTIIPLLGLLIGFGLGGFMVYDGWTSVPVHKYCVVYDDDFSSGLNPNVWTKEAEVGGFGNGQFEETTVTDENVFVKDGMLTIKPTLQDEKLISTNNVLNLTQTGICSSDKWKNCVASTNVTNGTIIPPARSGRINTKKGAQIRYGRVEVVAKMPAGDWLWPAIWMLPAENKYGVWPLSGEIDIAESRGNNYTYPQGGNNVIGSTLHWGPDTPNDAWWRTFGKTNALHGTFEKKFHTFGLEWSEKYIYMYLDSRLLQVMYNKFSEPLWQRGKFPLADANGTSFVNPWGQTGNPSTPFDQNFYLILNVAVGGTNGWFEDGVAGKPWVDGSPTAPKDFWNARDRWYPTWTDPTLRVKSVKMWQQEGYNGC